MTTKTTSKHWLKSKVRAHLSLFNNPSVIIHRDYYLNRVIIDYFGGRCVIYDYSSKWIAG